MRNKTKYFLSAFLALASVSASPAKQEGFHFDNPDWDGWEDKDGCGAYRIDGRITVSSSADDEFVGFRFKKGLIPEGTYKTQIKLGAKTWTGQSSVFATEVGDVLTWNYLSEDFVEGLRRWRSLVLSIYLDENNVTFFDYSLDGTKEAIEAVEACVGYPFGQAHSLQ
ncbi:hypothetical protein [Rhizobium sp. L1K21]|uniref:hypothetical protein n=1 Tax=Rhizobium sp. L1K21 TaxID=2954933 RepID=UPI002093D246|nr:hypothetical protein [Rhizobium sp. L1K21]MCO6188536.1 hypothetical protein [Rhizobium sp. L1K21]